MSSPVMHLVILRPPQTSYTAGQHRGLYLVIEEALGVDTGGQCTMGGRSTDKRPRGGNSGCTEDLHFFLAGGLACRKYEFRLRVVARRKGNP